jgi:hypothetical protein
MDLEGHLTLEPSHEELEHFSVHVNRLRVLPSIFVRAADTPLRGVTARLYTHALPGGSRVVPAGQMDRFLDIRPPDSMESAADGWDLSATPVELGGTSPIDVAPFQLTLLALRGRAEVPYCYDCLEWGGAEMRMLRQEPAEVARRRGELRGHVAMIVAVHVVCEGTGLSDWYQMSLHCRPVSKMGMAAEVLRFAVVEPDERPRVAWSVWPLYEDEPPPR